MDTLYEVLYGFFAFSLLIIITVGWHELGHFIVARLSGVKVLEFAIGMGKDVYSKKLKDGVNYKVCMLPIGGYVRMLTDNDIEEDKENKYAAEDKNKTFEAASTFKRSLIVAAGPFANFILAIGIFSYLGYNYTYSITPEVGYVSEQIKLTHDSDNLEVGDVIVSSNGKAITSVTDFTLENITGAGEIIEIKTETNKTVKIDLSDVTMNEQNSDMQLAMGFSFISSTVSNEVSEVILNSPSDKGGMKKDDIIVSINDIKTPNFYEIQRQISTIKEGSVVSLVINREGVKENISITPDFKGNDLKGKRAVFGFSSKYEDLDKKYLFNEPKTILESVSHGINKTIAMSKMTAETLIKIFTGDISPMMLGGAVTIGHAAKVSLDNGFVSFMGFLALFNVNLMVMNLLPIPPLDGGHLAKFGVETVIRRKVKESYEVFVQKIGFAAVATLLAWGVFADYVRFLM